MSTTVYKIDDEGNIDELATYSQPPKQSLKNAFLQFIKNNWNTWNYSNINVDIKEGKRGFHIPFGDNSVLFTREK